MDSKENKPDARRPNGHEEQSVSGRSGSPRYNLRTIVFCLIMAVVLMLMVHVWARFELRDAVVKGQVRKVRVLVPLVAGKLGINSTNMYGYGPMQLAAQYGHIDILTLLIAHGGDVNLRRPSSWNSPLIMAASRGHTDCCRLLLDNGADPNEVGYFGGTQHTALQSTSRGGHLEVVDFFLSRGIGPNEKKGSTSALHQACRADHLDVVKKLIAAGADINSTQEWDHNTPLELAMEYDNTEIVEFLSGLPSP